MTATEKRRQADKAADGLDEPMQIMDGFDGCLLGTVTLTDGTTTLVYDRALVIKQLMRDGPMSYQDAREYHDFNQAGAYVGPGTPLFVDVFK